MEVDSFDGFGDGDDGEFCDETQTSRGIYRGPNCYLKKNWTEFKKLPDKLLLALERSKRPAALDRVSEIASGNVPYFYFEDSIPSGRDWPDTLRDFLLEESETVINYPPNPGKARKRRDTLQFKLDPRDETSSSGACRMTNEQSDALRDVLSLFDARPSGDSNESRLGVYVLHGQAGSGKSFLIKYLLKHSLSVHYLTTALVLCHNIKSIYKRHNLYTSTICKFVLDAFKMVECNFFSFKILQELLVHVDYSTVASLIIDGISMFQINGNPSKARLRWINLRKRFCPKTLPRHLVFLDEYSLLTEGMLGMITCILKSFERVAPVSIVLVFAGDSNQIQPLFKATNSGGGYNFLDNIADKSKIFQSQKRITDPEYNQLLQDVLHSDNLQRLLEETFRDDDKRDVVYNYPISEMNNMPPADDYSNFIEWFDTKQIYKTCGFIIFSYTNVEMHYNNIALALSIYNKLKRYKERHEGVECFVQFQVLRKVSGSQLLVTYPIKRSENCQLPILPLVKGFPYKILTRDFAQLPRLSIVYLASWNDTGALVYHLETKSIHKITFCNFQMNLFGDGTVLYGLPLQMNASETFYSSQGLTIDRDIYANFARASRSEVYVVLSRVREKKKCKSIHVPSLNESRG